MNHSYYWNYYFEKCIIFKPFFSKYFSLALLDWKPFHFSVLFPFFLLCWKQMEMSIFPYFPLLGESNGSYGISTTQKWFIQNLKILPLIKWSILRSSIIKIFLGENYQKMKSFVVFKSHRILKIHQRPKLSKVTYVDEENLFLYSVMKYSRLSI